MITLAEKPLSADEYRRQSSLIIKCPTCGRVAEIQRVKVRQLYDEYMKLQKDFPDPEKLDEEIKKTEDRLSTIAALMISGMKSPRIDVIKSENVLGFDELDDCCGKYYLEQIIEFSGMSPKADSARIIFARTEPAQTTGLAAILSGTRPSEYIDVDHELTDYERAALDCAIITETRKLIDRRVREKTSLDNELDEKYQRFNEVNQMWS